MAILAPVASPGGRLQKVARGTALAVASTVVGFALLELGARWLLPSASPLERIYPADAVRRPQPYTMFGGAPHGQLTIPPGNPERLNELGYRGAEPTAHKPDGEVRVFVVGGSTVFEGDPSLPALLEESLHERDHSGVRCFNYGVLSSVSGQELARVVFEVADHQPDLVVMFNGANDLTSPVQYDPRPGYPYNFLIEENNPLLRRDVSSYPTWTLFAYGSHLLRILFPGYFAERFAGLESLREDAGYLTPEWRDQIAQGYVVNLVKTQRVAQAFGADFLAVFQPLVFFKEILGPREQEIAAPLEGFGNMARDLRFRTRLALDEARRRNGLAMQDLSGVFDGVEDDVFYDFVHVTEEGKRILAEAMAEEIAPRLGSERPTSEP